MQNIKPLATISGYLGATVPTYKKITSTVAYYLSSTLSGLKSLR